MLFVFFQSGHRPAFLFMLLLTGSRLVCLILVVVVVQMFQPMPLAGLVSSIGAQNRF